MLRPGLQAGYFAPVSSLEVGRQLQDLLADCRAFGDQAEVAPSLESRDERRPCARAQIIQPLEDQQSDIPTDWRQNERSDACSCTKAETDGEGYNDPGEREQQRASDELDRGDDAFVAPRQSGRDESDHAVRGVVDDRANQGERKAQYQDAQC